MRPSDVYRKAALMMERYDGKGYFSSPYACDKIGEACGWFNGSNHSELKRLEYVALRDRFTDLFSKRISNPGDTFFGVPTARNQNARVLALCFMASIAESEEQ